jgi:16S rRNA (cytosine1402-N4)-methyltransferase
MRHEPVLLTEVVEFLRPAREDGVLVDATLGLGGHSAALLRAYPRITLLGIDRDPDALAIAAENLREFGSRVVLARGRHEELIEILKQQQVAGRIPGSEISGLLADLGVSSMQLDEASRGFSFRQEGPLDMRMSREGESAADLVNDLEEAELAKIIRDYGEEPMAKRIARAIVAARAEARIETTTQLSAVIRSVKKSRPHEIDPSTLTFQALRIATNRELVELDHFVEAAVSVAEQGARVAIITFHSLEDRIVKRAIRRLEGECTCPPGFPVCACGYKETVEALTRHPLVASEEEMQRNPRSRSAKLRVAEKL